MLRNCCKCSMHPITFYVQSMTQVQNHCGSEDCQGKVTQVVHPNTPLVGCYLTDALLLIFSIQ